MGKAKRPNKKRLQILKKGDTFLKGKRQAIYILIALMFFGLIGGMIAYLTDAETAVNEVSVGKNEIEIEEDFDPPDEIPPGASFPKKSRFVMLEKGIATFEPRCYSVAVTWKNLRPLTGTHRTGPTTDRMDTTITETHWQRMHFLSL